MGLEVTAGMPDMAALAGLALPGRTVCWVWMVGMVVPVEQAVVPVQAGRVAWAEGLPPLVLTDRRVMEAPAVRAVPGVMVTLELPAQ